MDTKEPLFLIPSEQDFHNVPYKFPKKRNNNSPKLFESYFKSIEYSDNEEEHGFGYRIKYIGEWST